MDISSNQIEELINKNLEMMNTSRTRQLSNENSTTTINQSNSIMILKK